jgi:phosphoribosyl-dephospho-CoA transferase
MTGPAKRHDLVLVVPDAWRSLLRSRPELVVHPLVSQWADESWPLIRRRPLSGEDGIALGLPLPPMLGRQRLSMNLPIGAVRASHSPPLLADCTVVAPPAWRGVIAKLLTVDDSVRCFGSLAWQRMTGLAYLRPQSDLDLLWTVRDGAHAMRLSQSIAAIASTTSLRLDGELQLASGDAVQWREWLSGASQLLVKSITGISMTAREALFL